MKKFNGFNKLAVSFLIISMVACSHGKAGTTPVQGRGKAQDTEKTDGAKEKPKADVPTLHLVLGQDRKGQPTRLLRAVWPSHAGQKFRDRWGREWTLDASGQVQMPETITMGMFTPPSPETYPFDAQFASHLVAMGQESKGVTLFLSMLRVVSPLRDTVKGYFCDLWKVWKARGASWESLLGAVVGIEYADLQRITVENVYHGFGFDVPGPWLWGGARVPVQRGEASLLWLAPVSGKFNVLVVAVTEPDMVCPALRVKDGGCDLEKGTIAFSPERIGRVAKQTLGDLTIAFVVIGPGPEPSSLASTLRKASYDMPCPQDGTPVK